MATFTEGINYFEEWDRASFKGERKHEKNDALINSSGKQEPSANQFWDKIYAEVGKAENGEIGFDEFKTNMLGLQKA
jgi:hypothetical protein